VSAASERRPIILDCDPGHDDAIAILLAAASPALELLAITTVAGNQTLDKTTLNARRVCTVAGITGVPIAAGSARPLERELRVAADIHGESGLDGPIFPDPRVPLDPRPAADLIVELGMEREGPTLVATGPLTNVATALEREPRLVDRLREIVFMGGAIGLGNWTPAAEFNIWWDPEAADRVLSSGARLVMVPLEVTHRALATEAVLARLEAIGSPVATMAVDLMRYFAATYREVFGFPAPAVHDPCAVARVIDPQLVPGRPMHVAVERRSELCDGRTVCDVHGITRQPPNVDVATGLDVDRFWGMVVEAVASYPA
jgi:inosine-uridine nucleoside N-ribohydrolase